MLQKFEQHIAKTFPFFKGKKLLIATSGGVDSVVLTYLCSSLKGVAIALAHCNFQLRKEDSNLDEAFVKQLAKKHQVTFFTKKFNTQEFAKKNKLSIQIAAREQRYQWFQKIAKEHHFSYILTAHHATDNLETVLINLTRGTGLEGLTGIPVMQANIARPLLAFSREEIVLFAKKNKLIWREDTSNLETKYIRNKIRHQIVPVLKEINPEITQTIANTIQFLQESEQIIEDQITAVSKDIIQLDATNKVVEFNIKKLLALSNPKAYLYQMLKSYHFTQWDDIVQLLNAQPGKYVFSKTHRLLKDRDFLLLTERDYGINSSFLITEKELEISTPIFLSFKKHTLLEEVNKQTILVDKKTLKFPLTVRKWQKGDYFYPAGMQGKKKLSKYFKDEKLSLVQKENSWLLCNADTQIIWVIGMRQDRRFLITKNTQNAIQIRTK